MVSYNISDFIAKNNTSKLTLSNNLTLNMLNYI